MLVDALEGLAHRLSSSLAQLATGEMQNDTEFAEGF